MIDGSYAALSALGAFSKKAAVVSNNVANMHTDGYKKSRAILEEAQRGHEANLKSLAAQSELQGTILDILG